MTKVQKVKEKVILPLIDLLLSKTISKKLIAFIIATVALFKDKLTGTEWTFIACLYILGLVWLNHLHKMAEIKKNIDNTNNEQP